MFVSRRALLRRIGLGAAASAALPLVGELSFAATTEPSRFEPPVRPVRLNKNENAYGPSDKARAALREELDLAHRYPEPADALVERIAALHGVGPEQVVVGCGSVEILRMAAAASLGRRRSLVLASPTFDPIVTIARDAGAAVVPVPLDRHHAYDLDAMRARAGASAGLVYICNPHNPTGTLTPREELERFIRRLPAATHVVIDEAYHHYAGTSSTYASFIDRPLDDRRVVVTRTLSKVHGLAGLRLGYAVTAPETARRLSTMRLPMAINVLAPGAAGAALEDGEHVRLSVQRNANDRQEFYNQANARMLRIIDSHANFVMLKSGVRAEDAVEHLKKEGILVAPPIPSMPKYIRVSLGRPEEMREFWRAWDRLPHGGMEM
jgi:histidinol-phosphate aminotransferase